MKRWVSDDDGMRLRLLKPRLYEPALRTAVRAIGASRVKKGIRQNVVFGVERCIAQSLGGWIGISWNVGLELPRGKPVSVRATQSFALRKCCVLGR